MVDHEQRKLLGAFIRARREAMEPAGSGRRRTPGLRREELAMRAGISATWCSWLEQGREVQASPQALSRLAHALGLSRAERSYLFELAGRHDPEALAPEHSPATPGSLVASVQALAIPAYGLDRFWNACCWNAAAKLLFTGWLDTGERPSLLHFIFLNPAARRLIPDWEARALRIVAEFRADYSHALNDPAMNALVQELAAASQLFARGWRRQAVLAREGGKRTFRSTDGEIETYEQHTLVPADAPDHKMVILIRAG